MIGDKHTKGKGGKRQADLSPLSFLSHPMIYNMGDQRYARGTLLRVDCNAERRDFLAISVLVKIAYT